MTPALTRVIEAALEGRFKLESTTTESRDFATQVAKQAAEAGTELVVGFGGDGLINEITNGIAGTDTALGIIPGGTMNVFARNTGVPKDPLEAADAILRWPDTKKTAEFGLGKVEMKSGDFSVERLFTFACGSGFDAEAAARVESHKSTKRRFGEPYFYAAAFATFVNSYFTREPFIECDIGSDTHKVVMAIALAPGPYAYLMGRPVKLTPNEEPFRRRDLTRLDLFLVEKMRYWHVPSYALGAALTGKFGPAAEAIDATAGCSLRAEEPFAIHVDGEPLPPATSAKIAPASVKLKVLL